MLEKLQNHLTILIYGTVWGVLELTLGSFLHIIHWPGKGQIMGGIAYIILATYVIKYKTFWHPIVIGIIAASFKLFNVLIFGVPILSRAIVNPATAIIAEAASVTVVAFIISKYQAHKAALAEEKSNL